MKTQAAIELFQYWNRLRGNLAAPDRSQIEPSDIRSALAHTFIIEAPWAGEEPFFRLAGTAICSLFGKHLRETAVRKLFQDKQKPIVSRLMRNCYQDYSVILLGFEAATATGRLAQLEMVMLPLQNEKDGHRILGCLVAQEYQFWHGLEAIEALDLQSIRVIDPDREPLFLKNRPEIALPPSLVPGDHQVELLNPKAQKRDVHFLVIQGGKT